MVNWTFYQQTFLLFRMGLNFFDSLFFHSFNPKNFFFSILCKCFPTPNSCQKHVNIVFFVQIKYFILLKFLVGLKPCFLTFSFTFNFFIKNLHFISNRLSRLYWIDIYFWCEKVNKQNLGSVADFSKKYKLPTSACHNWKGPSKL